MAVAPKDTGLSTSGAARLDVLVRSREGREPLSRVRVGLSEAWSSRRHRPGQTPQVYWEFTDGTQGTLEIAPITGDDGRVSFTVPPGMALTIEVGSEEPGVREARQDLTPLVPAERREVTIDLRTGRDLPFWGRLLTADGRAPVQGARVEALDGELSFQGGRRDSWNARVGVATSDEDGYFHLGVSSERSFTLRVAAAGLALALATPGPGHTTREEAFELLLQGGATLRARVVGHGGEALEGSVVRLTTAWVGLEAWESDMLSFPSIEDPHWEAAIDSRGIATLSGLPPGVPLKVVVLRTGHEPWKDPPPLTLRSGELREVEWLLGEGCRLEGLAVDARGEPQADLEIWLLRAEYDAPAAFQPRDEDDAARRTRTDGGGRFVLEAVSAGSWWIGPAPQREGREVVEVDAVAPIGQVIAIPDGAIDQEVLLTVHRGLYLHGRVLDPSGAPVRRAHVLVESPFTSAECQLDGTFVIGPLAAGAHTVFASGGRFADSEPVEVTAGDSGVVLRLREGGVLRGQVIDGRDGTPCAAEVQWGATGEPWGYSLTQCRSNGSFTLSGLLPGTYEVIARAGDGRIGHRTTVPVRAGNENETLVVTLEPGARLALSHHGDTTLYVRLSQGTRILEYASLRPGERSEFVLAPGPVQVAFAYDDDHEEERTITLAPGEARELVLE